MENLAMKCSSKLVHWWWLDDQVFMLKLICALDHVCTHKHTCACAPAHIHTRAPARLRHTHTPNKCTDTRACMHTLHQSYKQRISLEQALQKEASFLLGTINLELVTVVAEIFVRVKIPYSRIGELSYPITLLTMRADSNALVDMHRFCMLLIFVRLAKVQNIRN